MRDKQESDFDNIGDNRSELADALHKRLRNKGIDFATGVPCGVLKYVIRNIEEDRDIIHVPANRESEAIGIAAGAFFSGKRSVIYMQNSGLFSASNDIASLLVPYKIPILFLVSHRGCKGEDAIQHQVTGRGTEVLLRTLGLSYVTIDKLNMVSSHDTVFRTMIATSLPFVLLFRRGWSK